MKIDLTVITNYLRENQVNELSIIDLRDHLISSSTGSDINKTLLRQKISRAFTKLVDSNQLVRVDNEKRKSKFALIDDRKNTLINRRTTPDTIHQQHSTLVNRLEALKLESLTLEGALEEYVHLKRSSPELVDILAPEYERTKGIQLKIIGKISAIEKLLEIRQTQQ